MTESSAPAPASAGLEDTAVVIPDAGSQTDLTGAAAGLPEAVTPAQLELALEAICFALNRSLTVGEAAAILRCSRAQLTAAAEVVATRLRGGGLMLQRHHDEIQLVTSPEAAWAVQRALNPERPARVSRASLETLAIVAYRQPVTRAAVEAIRGVNCDAVLDNLERRELIVEVGRQETPGHPRLYGTTLRFLQVVGLERIENLPPLGAGDTPAVTAALLGLRDEDESAGTPDPEAAEASAERPPGSAVGAGKPRSDVGQTAEAAP